ncbi:MAG: glycogen/starch synthase [Halioglobus sp.]|nr:glycogen/starch synthase [Halioglobus sp.]
MRGAWRQGGEGDQMLIWMAAAENDALPGGKVGGVGDVMRDLPVALAGEGHEVCVFTPSYGRFHCLPGSRKVASIPIQFGGRRRIAALYQVDAGEPGVTTYVVEHGQITAGHPGKIYFDDGPGDPFASDATRFAFFSAVLAAWAERAEQAPDVIHAHDWHLGPLFLLRRFGKGLTRLRRTRCVFSIHNLAYQGIRPFEGHRSSVRAWFPGLRFTKKTVVDPRYSDCVNLMAAAIRLADGINTVSPGYARDILCPSDPASGFIGGEGLEDDLRQSEIDGRLSGILNGCVYPGPGGRRPGWERLLKAIAEVPGLVTGHSRKRLDRLAKRRPPAVLTSIGRITGQKTTLFLQPVSNDETALDAILRQHGQDAVFIMLGSGDPAMERQLEEMAASHENFLFLRGYAESLSHLLYKAGDLFLMPSSFEPCGISQMLAMREGQPCVVHAVGGLRDTVRDGVTGFQFRGSSQRAQARQFVAAVASALALKQDDPSRWRKICECAAQQRFTWEDAARQYLVRLYAN